MFLLARLLFPRLAGLLLLFPRFTFRFLLQLNSVAPFFYPGISVRSSQDMSSEHLCVSPLPSRRHRPENMLEEALAW